MLIKWTARIKLGKSKNFIIALLLSSIASSAYPAGVQRIASVNLCADQLLLAIASHGKIVALGPFARDPSMSFFAREAIAFPQLSGRSEPLIGLKVDAVAVGPFDNRFMRTILKRHNVPEIVVDRWSSVNSMLHGVQAFGDRIGESENAKRLVAEIESDLQGLQARVRRSPPATFLFLHRRGLIGEAGIVSELLEIAGMRDVAKNVEPRFLSVEGVLALRPDFLVLTGLNQKLEDRGLELLEHPALRRLYPETRRITAPDRLTACAGPATSALIRHLRAELDSRLEKQ
jgi:iron complex transport system substrate-binding protein